MNRTLKTNTQRETPRRASRQTLPRPTRGRQIGAGRVAEIRRQIAAGAYLTDEKLDAAIEALLNDLRAAPDPRRVAVG